MFSVIVLLTLSASAQTRVDTLADGGICEYTLVNGLVQGTRTYWKDGFLVGRQSLLNGLLDGTEYWYYPSGTVKKRIEFENGTYHGEYQKFDAFGVLVETKWFYFGKEVDASRFKYLSLTLLGRY